MIAVLTTICKTSLSLLLLPSVANHTWNLCTVFFTSRVHSLYLTHVVCLASVWFSFKQKHTSTSPGSISSMNIIVHRAFYLIASANLSLHTFASVQFVSNVILNAVSFLDCTSSIIPVCRCNCHLKCCPTLSSASLALFLYFLWSDYKLTSAQRMMSAKDE